MFTVLIEFDQCFRRRRQKTVSVSLSNTWPHQVHHCEDNDNDDADDNVSIINNYYYYFLAKTEAKNTCWNGWRSGSTSGTTTKDSCKSTALNR